jgi:hypothetical protein
MGAQMVREVPRRPTIRPATARAVRDAMPFLRRAGRIEVVIVTNERSKQDQIERADIGAHLARHGLNVAINRMPRDVDVAALLLSHASDENVDFIVMGGLRPLAFARIRAWRCHPQHVANYDRAGTHVPLIVLVLAICHGPKSEVAHRSRRVCSYRRLCPESDPGRNLASGNKRPASSVRKPWFGAEEEHGKSATDPVNLVLCAFFNA